MSTRGCFTFIDAEKQQFHVYKHSDCYPEGPYGGPAALCDATRHAWAFPRFEADEFAAGFITAAKLSTAQSRVMKQYHDLLDARREAGGDRREDDLIAVQMQIPCPDYQQTGGGVRLLKSGHWWKVAPWDIAWHYTLQQKKEGGPILAWAAQVTSEGSGDNERMADDVQYEGDFTGMVRWGMKLKEDQDRLDAAEAAAKSNGVRFRPARLLL